MADHAIAKLCMHFDVIATKCLNNHKWREVLAKIIDGYEKETVCVAVNELSSDPETLKYKNDNHSAIIEQKLRSVAMRRHMANMPENIRQARYGKTPISTEKGRKLLARLQTGAWDNVRYVVIPKYYPGLKKMRQAWPRRFKDHPKENDKVIYKRMDAVEDMVYRMEKGWAPFSLQNAARNTDKEMWPEIAREFIKERQPAMLPPLDLRHNRDEVMGILPGVTLTFKKK